MKIILSGGGSGKDTKELDEKFASLLDKSKSLLYIPIAIDNIKHPYPDCLRWLKSTFDKLKVTKYEMWVEEDLTKSKKTPPNDFAGIYIGGGNTPYLLKKLKESGFWDFLKKAINLNIPVYGGSAGAVVFSKTILHSLYNDKNWVEIKDLDGMNILNNYEITVHYNKDKEKKLMEISRENKLDLIIALTEKNGVYVADNKIILIGQEPGYLFSNGKIKKIPLGESIS